MSLGENTYTSTAVEIGATLLHLLQSQTSTTGSIANTNSHDDKKNSTKLEEELLRSIRSDNINDPDVVLLSILDRIGKYHSTFDNKNVNDPSDSQERHQNNNIPQISNKKFIEYELKYGIVDSSTVAQYNEIDKQLSGTVDERTVKDYLIWRRMHKPDNAHDKRRVRNDCGRMAEWDWLQVCKWIENYCNEFSYLAGVFSEFKINGCELLSLALLPSSNQIEILARMSGFWTEYLHNNKKMNSNKINFEQLHKQLNNAVAKYRVKVICQNIYQSNWSQIMTSVRDNKDNNHELATLVYNLVASFRATDGKEAIYSFWKENGIFFSKIDNLLAVLTLPDSLKARFVDYYPNYLSNNNHNDEINILAPPLSTIESIGIVEDDHESDYKDKNTQMSNIVMITDENGFEVKDDELKNFADEDKIDNIELMMYEQQNSYMISNNNNLGGINLNNKKCFGNKYKFLDEFFWKPMCCLVIGILISSITLISWWFSQANWQINESMNWTVQSIEQRSLLDMELAFGIPQAVMQVMIDGLYTEEFATDDTLINGSYYDFWNSFAKYDTSGGIFDVYVYNDNYTTMYGAFWPNRTNFNDIFTYNYNGSCAWDDYFTYKDYYCDYNPEIRPWYNLSLTLIDDQRKWTDLYLFAGSNQVFGLTMVQEAYYNNMRFVFGLDFTIDTIQPYMDSLKIPLDGVLYIANDDLSVVASTVNQVDVPHCDLDFCSARNKLLKESIEIFRKHKEKGALDDIIEQGIIKWEGEEDGATNLATISTFDVTWSTNASAAQSWIMIIAYSDAYLDDINNALWVSIAVSSVMVIGSIIIIILVQKAAMFIQETSLNDETIQKAKYENKSNKKQHNRYVKFLASLKDNNIKRLITMSKIGLCLTLGTIYIVLNNASNLSFTRLVETIMVKEEYNQIENSFLFQLSANTESILGVLEDRFKRHEMPTYWDPTNGIFDQSMIDPRYNETIMVSSLAKFYYDTMTAYQSNNRKYRQFGLHHTDSNGTIYVTSASNSSVDTANLITSFNGPSTDYLSFEFLVPDDLNGYFNFEEDIYSTYAYDPRCRDWWINAIAYTFNGTFEQAFPISNKDFRYYMDDLGDLGATQECIDARTRISNLFDLEKNPNTSDYYSASNVILSKQANVAWTRYIFVGHSVTVGLTAAKAIQNETTGELLGVVAVDYALTELSNFLNATNDDDNWLAWAFETNNSEMVASSEGQVLTAISGLAGLTCVSESDQYFAYQVSDHPNDEIAVFSQLVTQVNGIDNLPINSSNSKTIDTVIDSPYIEAGRIQVYPGNIGDEFVIGIDYIMVKSIDLSELTASITDVQLVTFIVSCMVLLVCLYAIQQVQRIIIKHDKKEKLEKENRYQSETDDDPAGDSDDDSDFDVDDEDTQKQYEASKNEVETRLRKMMDIWAPIIKERASVEWKQWQNENMKVTHEDAGLVKMSYVKEFCNKKAKEYLKFKDKNTIDKMMIIDESLFVTNVSTENSNYYKRLLLFKIIPSGIYIAFVECVMLLHIFTAFLEPVTPNQLLKEGWTGELVLNVLFCMIVEWIDLGLTFFSRFTRFKIRTQKGNKFYSECRKLDIFSINNDKTAKSRTAVEKEQEQEVEEDEEANSMEKNLFFWQTDSDFLRTFFGQRSFQFNCVVFIQLIILINFFCTIIGHIGIFSYYVPIVPFLFMFHNNGMYHAMKSTLFALNKAKDVLVLFVTMLIVSACLGIALFQKYLNIDLSIDNYTQISKSIVTSFTYSITGENYNNLVTTTISSAEQDSDSDEGASYWLLIYFFAIIIINLFCLIPLLILRFDNAYSEIGRQDKEKREYIKQNAILASFIMLDIDQSKSIARNEFQDLFLFTDVKLLNKFEKMKQNLSLQQYTKIILGQQLILVDDSTSSKKIQFTNKWQAYLECNVICSPIYRWCSLLFGIIPGLSAALVYGLSSVDQQLLNVLVIFSYVYNVVSILLKIYALGLLRYFNYDKYDNPPYVEWCIYEKQRNKIKSIPLSLHYLNHDDWKWCKQHLSHNYINNKNSKWQKKYQTMVNIFDFTLVVISLIGIICSIIFLNGANSLYFNNIGYMCMWLLLPLTRLFVLLKNNKIITFELIQVLSKGNTFNIFVFAILYVFIWARLGTTLFYGKSKIVLQDIYNTDANTGFDSLTKSILLLIQISLGDSWGDIMYVNVLATSISSVYYFVVFVLIITLFIVNIIIGLILAGVDAIEDQINQSKNKYHH